MPDVAEQIGALLARARELRLTPSTVVHGGWGLALGAWTGRDDVVLGSTASSEVKVSRAESIAGELYKSQTRGV